MGKKRPKSLKFSNCHCGDTRRKVTRILIGGEAKLGTACHLLASTLARHHWVRHREDKRATRYEHVVNLQRREVSETIRTRIHSHGTY